MLARRSFRIAVRRCKGCGREWPAHIEGCHACAAALDEPWQISCERLTPPPATHEVAPMLAVVAAVELSRRSAPAGDWAAAAWTALAPLIADAVGTWPGPSGTIVAAWPLGRRGALADVATRALDLRERVATHAGGGIELRGGIVVGVTAGDGRGDAVECCAEQLALAAAPSQWLVLRESARRLQSLFELRGVGVVPRWPMAVSARCRALGAPLDAPVLPSAVTGAPPALVLGRAAERRRLLSEFAAAAAGERRVLLVSAPAGGGKSHLLRRVLADAELELAAGVAFPPLGARTLEPLRALLGRLDSQADGSGGARRLGARIGAAACLRASERPAVVVADDIHWADRDSLVALRSAIAASDPHAPLVWVLSARTATLPRLGDLVALADAHIGLPPLECDDRIALLERRLGALPGRLRSHVAREPARGNPLYLEHLADVISEEVEAPRFPESLHDAVLMRLDRLSERTRALSHWTRLRADPQRELQALERELGGWLDRLETSDLADLATIGRYLGKLRQLDAELVIARALLGMPVTTSRRLAHALERLAETSTDALLDYLGTIVRSGRLADAVGEAVAAAGRAELSMRLADAERLFAFASEHEPGRTDLLRHRGDLALALGRPQQALDSYRQIAATGGTAAELERRIARALATAGCIGEAMDCLARATPDRDGDSAVAYALALDDARLRGVTPPSSDGPVPAAVHRRAARAAAWARAGDPAPALAAARQLALDDSPAASAAELVETAALARLAHVEIDGLSCAGRRAAEALANPGALALLETADIEWARRTFVHWDV